MSSIGGVSLVRSRAVAFLAAGIAVARVSPGTLGRSRSVEAGAHDRPHSASLAFRLFPDQAMMPRQRIRELETMDLSIDMLTAFVRSEAAALKDGAR